MFEKLINWHTKSLLSCRFSVTHISQERFSTFIKQRDYSKVRNLKYNSKLIKRIPLFAYCANNAVSISNDFFVKLLTDR